MVTSEGGLEALVFHFLSFKSAPPSRPIIYHLRGLPALCHCRLPALCHCRTCLAVTTNAEDTGPEESQNPFPGEAARRAVEERARSQGQLEGKPVPAGLAEAEPGEHAGEGPSAGSRPWDPSGSSEQRPCSPRGEVVRLNVSFPGCLSCPARRHSGRVSCPRTRRPLPHRQDTQTPSSYSA